MFRILGIIVVALLGFYVAWPGYSAYRIKTALDTGDAALLAAKVDFDGVRTSLRPAVTTEVEKAMTAAVQAGGAGNEPLLQQLKGQVMPKVVEGALAAVVTPESILRILREGNDYKVTLIKIIGEKMGSGGLGALTGAPNGGGGFGDLIGKATGIDAGKALGGLFGKKDGAPAPAPVTDSADNAGGAAKRTFTMANVKSFAINGPLGFSIGIAKDPAATAADVTADLAFTGGDWKVVGLRPRV